MRTHACVPWNLGMPVYRVPWCPMNVLATPYLVEQNISQFTSPRGYELHMPGFANRTRGKYGMYIQEADDDGNPVLVFNLGNGSPVMRTMLVDDGNAWQITDGKLRMCCTAMKLHVR